MSSRVPGHTLAFEGAPHLVTETGSVSRIWKYHGGVSGTGRGLCSCGAMSDLLESAHQRKKWHRAHKAEVSHRGACPIAGCPCAYQPDLPAATKENA